MRTLTIFSLCIGAGLPGHADSLWVAAGSPERAMFSDQKATRVGDILTVVVSESASQSSSQKKNTSRESRVDASVSQFLFPASVSSFGTYKGATPGIKFGGSTDFSGGGQVSNSQTINARAAVLVTDVLPNGNLVIEGARRMTFSGETQHIVLHGVVRAADVSPENTVLSSNIANARVEFITDGDLTDSRKKGWLTKLYDKLSPF